MKRFIKKAYFVFLILGVGIVGFLFANQQCYYFGQDKLCIDIVQLDTHKYSLQVNIDSPKPGIKFLSCKLLSPTGKLNDFGKCKDRYIITYRDFPNGYSLYINYNLRYSKYIPLSDNNIANPVGIKVSQKLKNIKNKLLLKYPQLKNEKKWLLFTDALIQHSEKYAYGQSDKIKTYEDLVKYVKLYINYTKDLIAKYKD